MTIENKVALVTGASRGIGQAIALALGKQNNIVVGTATTEGGAQSIDTYLSERGIKGAGVCLDVRNPHSIREVLSDIGSRFAAPTILVNNAGITKDNLVLRMKEEEWDDVIATNLASVYHMSKACLRGMTKARWGRIINISSVVALMGNIGQANYAASKGGVEGFTRALAKEIGVRNITVNAIAPGFVETDMTKNMAIEHREKMIKMIALERLGKPEDIASVVAFFASEGSGYITGETLQVNGGLYMN